MNLADQMQLDVGDPNAPAQPKPVPQSNRQARKSLSSSMEADIAPQQKLTVSAVQPAMPANISAASLTPEDDPGPLLGVAGHALTAGGSALKGGLDVAARYGFGAWEGLTKLLSGGSISDAGKELAAAAQDAPGILQSAQEKGTYQPEPGSSAAKLSGVLDEYGPGALIGKGSEAAADWAEKHGTPPIVSTAIKEAPLIAGAVLGIRSLGVPAVGRALKGESTAAAEAAAALRTRVEPTLSDFSGEQTGEASIRQFVPGEPIIGTPLKTDSVTPIGTNRAPIKMEPSPPPNQVQTIEGGPGYRAGDSVTTAKASPEQRVENAKLLRRLGLDDARESAISEDPKAANTDYNASQPDTTEGKRMFNLMEKERGALRNTASDIAANTGKEPLASSYSVGKSMIKPLNGLEDWFDSNASRLYKEADQKAQGVPVKLSGFADTLADDSLATNSDRVQMRGAVKAYAKKLGLLSEDGTISGNALQAETMRKYLGENWSPQNGGLIGKLKDALDNDVLANAGENIHQQARAMWSLKKATLDNPNGISKLLDSEGINRKVNFEKIPDFLTSMGQDQFSHIVTTLNKITTDPALAHLQPAATQALNEIKGQFAQKIQDYGDAPKVQWGADSVKNYLQNNREKMQMVFSPEEMARFNDLNKGGQLLAKPTKYPGAEPQKQNLIAAGVMKSIPILGAATGEMVTGGTGLGAGIGAGVGNWARGKVEDIGAARAFNKRIVKLRDVTGE